MMTLSRYKLLYFDDVSDAIKTAIAKRAPQDCEIQFWMDLDGRQKEQAIAQAHVLIVSAARLDETLLLKAKQAVLIQKMGIGLDNIDLVSAARLGIPVCYTPGANAVAVAEHTILLILALFRKLIEVNEGTKRGEWMQWTIRPFTRDLYGKTHGIIGMGNIGRETAIRSAAFGTRLLYYSSRRLPETEEKKWNVSYATLDQLLKQSDIVSIHTPLTPQTKGMLNRDKLALMKPESVLINVARGGVVDEEALYEALCEGRIAGAGIDVWEEEPINPKVNKLIRLPQVIATSHVGAGTMDSFYRVFDAGFANISAVLNGAKPQHVVYHS